jgi:tetratricopeptide (TPR) repeat protein
LRRDLARALAAAGGLDEAVTLLDGLLAETPADPEALLERARIARWWGAFATARDLLRRAAAAAPRDPAVRAEQERTEAEARPFDGIAPPAGMRGVLERYAGAGLPLVAGMLLLALVLAYRGRAGDAAVGLTVAALALAGAWFAFFGSAR